MLGLFNEKQLQTSVRVLEPEPRYRVSPNGRTSSHPDGVVFLHMETGVLFKANRIGARIWEGVLNQDDAETIVSGISRDYAVPLSLVAEDTARFLADLEAQGFLCLKSGN